MLKNCQVIVELNFFKMKAEALYNKKSKEQLKKELGAETFDRITCSFYRYVDIEKPAQFRDFLYRSWNKFKILGRVYVAKEGINAQISCPDFNWNEFINSIEIHRYLKDVPIKRAIKQGESFYKLTIKVKKEIVAYGLTSNEYDMKTVGTHLSAKAFNKKIEQGEAITVDMRNYYESEVGRFENALTPDVDTSRELLPAVKEMLSGCEDNEILLYCTGGVRCEKASAYLIKQGFNKVSQLSGGIIQYAHDIKTQGIESKFLGKNFVFDNRMGESITDDVIGVCHQCERSADSHIDCANDACHILFIQCDRCFKIYNGCCSKECKNFASLPIEEQKKLRKDPNRVVSLSRYSSRVKPKLKEIIS